MKISYPYKNVIHFQFGTQYQMCSTFIRLQEFYESPMKTINSKYFSLEKYFDEHVKQYGKFDYFDIWIGFNIPGHIVFTFLKKFWWNLRKLEIELLTSIPLKYLLGFEKFYIIATYSEETIQHEVAHALWYLNKDYKKRMIQKIRRLPLKTRINKRKWLLKKRICYNCYFR